MVADDVDDLIVVFHPKYIVPVYPEDPNTVWKHNPQKQTLTTIPLLANRRLHRLL
jgi:hypothetical protein